MSNLRDGVDPRLVDYLIADFVRYNPGATTKDVAAHFRYLFKPSKLYGAHRDVASIIARLRAIGVFEDVARCPTCGQATTRGRRNGVLTLKGKNTGEKP